MTSFTQDLLQTAPRLARLVPKHEAEGLGALAYLVRNRAAWLSQGALGADGNGPPVWGASPRGAVLGAVTSLDLPPARPFIEVPAAFGALWSAFCGPEADPTFGATHVHHHCEAPSWAKGLRATALIGPYLFLTGQP